MTGNNFPVEHPAAAAHDVSGHPAGDQLLKECGRQGCSDTGMEYRHTLALEFIGVDRVLTNLGFQVADVSQLTIFQQTIDHILEETQHSPGGNQCAHADRKWIRHEDGGAVLHQIQVWELFLS